jgi:hypothetical protein
MRLCARPFSGSLLVAAFLIGAGAGAAVAQELQLDPKALDTSGAGSVQTKRGKGKRGADANAQQGASGKPAANGPNRQFGELEGWSPGKAPPKPKEKDDTPSTSAKPPVTVGPSGNMGTGFAF